jgi:hypothetical protein
MQGWVKVIAIAVAHAKFLLIWVVAIAGAVVGGVVVGVQGALAEVA